MEFLIVFAGLLALAIGAIIVASFASRPRNRQAPDLAAGSNKPDDSGPRA